MPGKRIDRRAHRPEEDRARKPSEDRGTRKRKMRMPVRNEDGLSARDAARKKAWEAQ